MTTPEEMFEMRKFILVDIRSNYAKQLLLLFMVLSMIIANMAIGYTSVDLIKIIQQWEEGERLGFGGGCVVLLTSVLVMGIAILGMRSLIFIDIHGLNAYVGFLSMSLLLQVYCIYDKADDMARPACLMTQSFTQNVKDLGLTEQRWIWDGIQSNNACCGLNSPADYLSMNNSIPMSCCPKAYARINEQARQSMYKYCIQTTAYYKTGCILKVLEQQEANVVMLVLGGASLIGMQLCGALLAICVIKNQQWKMQL